MIIIYSAIKFIAYLMHIASPNISTITNIGQAHIGRFGSQEVIAQTKSEIYVNVFPSVDDGC